ncbi:MAG: DUF559 domain-containing protein [Candidatus Saccharibacteria bacterium]|nr:DUF559 domain-containing protein [Pseudorhodobacter sp.]
MQQSVVQTAWARDLRRHPSLAQLALWEALRDRRFMGLKFRRRAPLGPLIVDFACLDRGFIVEVCDVSDWARDHWLAERGYLRMVLNDREVVSDLPGCLMYIGARLDGVRLRSNVCKE